MIRFSSIDLTHFTHTMTNTIHIEFDRQLIAGLPASGPRYTSYPTADRFHTDFGVADYQAALHEHHGREAMSLYIHIPFCNTICYYCGCNKIITKDKSRADEYLDYLDKELALQAAHWQGKPELAQLHFGGGTPTFLSDEQLARVFESIKHHFTLMPEGEYSIEIDPRKVSRDTVLFLGKLGFNRMSVGIQDFDPKVQQAVNRIQSEEETRVVIEAAREAGFKSVSVDLIYGLPHQTPTTMQRTLEKVLALSPDRLAVYHYAHLPHIFKPQRRIDTNSVPDSNTKLDILQNTVRTLLERGYVFIGMDHFAKPDDELAIALREGRLQRNFQGYSTHADCDLVAIGVSSIGKIGQTYSQNEKDIEAYYAALDEHRLPIMRGYILNKDDVLRRTVIQDLMCRFGLDFHAYIDACQGRSFDDYFAVELAELQALAEQGLLILTDERLDVTPKGRLVIRNIAMVFDHHLRHRQTTAKYSQTV